MSAAQLFSSDRPASEDAFNRLPFAKALAAALMQVSGRDGLVIGLEGGWGTGKSSLIEFLKAELKERATSDAAPVVVEFNPWMVSNTGALVDTLVTQIAAAISVGSHKANAGVKAGQKLLGYAGLLKHLKHLQYLKYVPGAGWVGHLADDLSAVGEAAGRKVDVASKALDELKKSLPTLDIAARRREVVDALKEFGRPILVIVDDLDRLPADEIRAIVQTIKAVADFPGTTYLLAYDRDVVVDALGNGKPQAGAAYMEKIVQVAYAIPPIPRTQLYRFLDDSVRRSLRTMSVRLHDDEDARLPQALELVSRLLRQPRDVARLLNRLVLSIPATHGNVNATDVIVMEALSQRFPAVRESIYRTPQAFVRRGFRDDHVALGGRLGNATEHPELPGSARSWDPYLPSDPVEGPLVGEALSFLFSQNDPIEDREEVALGMAESDRLARYFRLTSLDNVPDRTEIASVLRRPSVLTTMFAEDPAEANLYLQWMPGYLPTLAGIDVDGCIEAVAAELTARVARTALAEADGTHFATVLAALLRKLPRADGLRRLAELEPSLPLAVARLVMQWYDVDAAFDECDEEWEPTIEVEKVIRTNWAARVKAAHDEGTLPDERDFHRVLWTYADIADRREWAFNEAEKLWATEEGLRKFVAPLKNEGTEVKDLFLVRHPDRLASALYKASFAMECRGLIALLRNHQKSIEISENAETAIDPRRTSR